MHALSPSAQDAGLSHLLYIVEGSVEGLPDGEEGVCALRFIATIPLHRQRLHEPSHALREPKQCGGLGGGAAGR